MSEDALMESIIDRLSWNMILHKDKYKGKSVSDWLFLLEERLLTTYQESDRERVYEILTCWQARGYEVDKCNDWHLNFKWY